MISTPYILDYLRSFRGVIINLRIIIIKLKINIRVLRLHVDDKLR